MSMRVLEEMEREHDSDFCNCCLEKVVNKVLGTKDEDGLDDRIELIHRTMYDLWGGLMEPFAADPHKGLFKDTSNTDIMFHNGCLKTMWYLSGELLSVDPISLETSVSGEDEDSTLADFIDLESGCLPPFK